VTRRNADLLKSYAVLAVGPEGVTFKLLETLWYRRAVRTFNAAKASGRWVVVQVRLGDRVCVTYRTNPDEPHAEPPPAGAPPRVPASRLRPIA
jgi:hypothetical protein